MNTIRLLGERGARGGPSAPAPHRAPRPSPLAAPLPPPAPRVPELPAPLPAELAAALAGSQGPAPKRERTRRQLIDAALRMFSQRGVAATTIGDIAAAAGMAGATVYNHFASKDELVQAVAVWLARGLCACIADSAAAIPEAAERMAIGNRRYFWLAEQSPAWALTVLDVAAMSPQLLRTTAEYVLADLRLGVRQKAFRLSSEAAALDLVGGAVTQGMRVIAAGMAPPGHAAAVATLVLTGLGVPWDQARAVVRRPLPPLGAAR
ncbi:TetR/AcrR family transcriptional regulator [Aquabacterium sp.]|uniref:TetR/AcrR family transcriptional regulator n=1 Tax=Aquabacterium sp. TaxID=1872578 RepID=UPI002C204005|nr:TetR family transcriptional regulator [Aquabacterium sp.]HSW07972.1 TetR family transcriptional regulator [Aquabacterium sp.]